MAYIRRPKVLFVAFSFPSLVFLFYVFKPEAMDASVSYHLLKFKQRIVNLTTTDDKLLENIFKAKYKPHYNGKTIFFLETNFYKGKNVSLTARQACSVEAAGKIVMQKWQNV